jgi:UV DNA damage endonuclease
MRLGFAVKIMGEPLKEADLRRPQSGPILAQSLAFLREVFDYLERKKLSMYRMSSDLARYMTHPDFPQFHHQLPRYEQTLAELGSIASRLSCCIWGDAATNTNLRGNVSCGAMLRCPNTSAGGW